MFRDESRIEKWKILYGDITDYGAVSSRGMALYSLPSTEQAEETLEECEMVPNGLS